jgi:hypothetical protein
MTAKNDRPMDPNLNKVAQYAELPIINGTSEHHAWEIFGPDDELGTLNWLNPQQIIGASRLVKSGEVFNLNLPLNLPGSLSPTREDYEHHVEVSRTGRDDRLDNFYLQGSSQWDGLRHVRFRQHGYYGGRQEEDLDSSNTLGIEGATRKGIVGRGVLLDVAAYAESIGLSWNPGTRREIGVELLEDTAKWQGTERMDGDIILVRTGWLKWYLGLNESERAVVGPGETMTSVGLSADSSMPAWIWDTKVSAIVTDNVAVEALPVNRSVGFLHHKLIPLLGVLLGELWMLDAIAAACRLDKRYVGLLVAIPLPLPGGVGSPSNAYFIR